MACRKSQPTPSPRRPTTAGTPADRTVDASARSHSEGGGHMPFHVKPDESASRAVRRIAREQLRKIRDGVGQQSEGRDEAVHDARKRFKKLRALLKLVRGEVIEKTYRKENACFRDT